MKFLSNYGLWAIDEIKVKIWDDYLAWIDYTKYEVNAEKYRIVVKVGFFEKRKGVVLENKIQDSLILLRNKLIKENEKIQIHKNLEKKFNK